MLKSLYVKTTNEKYDDNKKNEFFKFGDLNYKIIKLKNLTFFLDYAKNMEDTVFTTKISEEETVTNKEKKEFLGVDYDFYCYCKSEVPLFLKN